MFQLWLSSGYTDQAECPAGVCTDCLPSYQLRMKKIGRCEHPETMFRMSSAGALFGTWSQRFSKKPIAQMTPEERREYKRDAMVRSREKAKAAEPAKPAADFWATRHQAMLDRMGGLGR